MNAFLEKSDCEKLTQESKDLLCKACELSQSRCSKLIIMRAKVCLGSKYLHNFSHGNS